MDELVSSEPGAGGDGRSVVVEFPAGSRRRREIHVVDFAQHGVSEEVVFTEHELQPVTLSTASLHDNPLTPTVAISIQIAMKHPVPDRVKPSPVIFDIRALWRLGLSVRVPITNDGLTWSGTGCFIAVPIWQQ